MSFFKPKFVVLALACALLPALSTSGCSGGAFTGDGTEAGAGSTSGGSGGSGAGAQAGTGTGGGTSVACDGPADCDDRNVCTLDRCNADGTCDASPKCTGTDKCCGGDCAQCCDDADCDDGLSCTANTCFAGQCMFVPDDSKCEASEYCSTKNDCEARQACSGLPGESPDVCDDDGGCTTDSCVGNFCQHDFCPDPTAKLCCDGVGCAACCNDSQCDDDKDPCTVGSCKEGKCSVVPLCGNGGKCCAGADGTSATCGTCCDSNECDDRIPCTEDKCGGGQCSNTPLAEKCPAGYLCDPRQDGCVKAPDCGISADCKPTVCQSNGKCDGGTCHFEGCAVGTKCCGAGTVGCAICCADSECNDNIPCTKDTCGANGCSSIADSTLCPAGYLCNAQLGCVAGCKVNSDCELRVITNAAIPPGTVPCTVSQCVKGQCQDTTLDCGDFQTCCNGVCALPSQCFSTE